MEAQKLQLILVCWAQFWGYVRTNHIDAAIPTCPWNCIRIRAWVSEVPQEPGEAVEAAGIKYPQKKCKELE